MVWRINMLFYENLEEIIFHRHELFDVDELVILSGYIGPQPVMRLKNLPFKTSVIYGMYGSDSISAKLHNSLQNANNENPNLEILYSKLPVHSKCYIWRKDKIIVTALIGSANFSINGLANPYKEVLAETTYDTFSPLSLYIEKVLNNSISCFDNSIKTKKQSQIQQVLNTNQNTQINICTATLLARNNEVGEKSGLNWGLSSAHTKEGDAYIAISKTYLENYPLLFPPKLLEGLSPNNTGKKTRQNNAVEFIWDDGTIMEGLLEGTQTLNSIIYPKNICSSPQKNILGKYLRARLGLSLNHKITRADLEAYGRTTIDISLQEEGIYYFDFSV